MRQELSPEHRLALAQYRLERAHSTLEEADYMRAGNYFNAAVNRLYYACFYAVSGLLVAKDIDAALVDYLRPRARDFIEAVELLVKKG